MDSAARIAAQRAIFRSTTSAHEINWVSMPKRTSLRFARRATELGVYVTEAPGIAMLSADVLVRLERYSGTNTPTFDSAAASALKLYPLNRQQPSRIAIF
jgi:hypothetical protein